MSDRNMSKSGEATPKIENAADECCGAGTTEDIREHMDVIASCGKRVGVVDEWHLVFLNSFQEITLGFPPWFSEVTIVIRVPFFEPRFKTIRTISHPVTSHCVE